MFFTRFITSPPSHISHQTCDLYAGYGCRLRSPTKIEPHITPILREQVLRQQIQYEHPHSIGTKLPQRGCTRVRFIFRTASMLLVAIGRGDPRASPLSSHPRNRFGYSLGILFMRPPVGRLDRSSESTMDQSSVDFVQNRRIAARRDLGIPGSVSPPASRHFPKLEHRIRDSSRLSGRSDTPCDLELVNPCTAIALTQRATWPFRHPIIRRSRALSTNL